MFIIIIKTELKDLGLNSRQISRMRTCNIFVDILLSSVLVSQKELPMKEEGRWLGQSMPMEFLHAEAQ